MMFPFGIPEEDREAYQQAMEQQAMEFHRGQLEIQDSLKSFFTSLDPKDLVTLKKMLHAIVASDDVMLAAYFEGHAQAILVYVHDVCPRCAVNHADKALDEILSDEDCMKDLGTDQQHETRMDP